MSLALPATLRPKRGGRSLLQQLVNQTGRTQRYVTLVKVVRYQIVTRVNYLSPALILKDLILGGLSVLLWRFSIELEHVTVVRNQTYLDVRR